jgi:tetratricopeptide (TPR) repeat protein
MYKSPIQIIRLTAILALVLVNCSCTSEMKKSRYLAQAERYFKAGEYDQAKIEYLKVLKVDPNNAVAYARCGAMWADEGVPLRAGAFLMKARELAPKDLENRYKLALVYFRIGQPKEAFKEATEILKQAPDNGPALALLAQTSLAPEQIQAAEQELQKFPQRDNPYVEVANAAQAIRKGDLAKAEAALNHALSLDPKCVQAHIGLAQLSLNKKDNARAGQELKAAADLSPVRSRERLTYAEFKTQTGDKEEAKSYLQDLTNQARDFIGAWVLQARIAQSDKKYDEVATLLQNVFSRDPDNIEGRVVQAQALLGKGDIKQGTDILERADKSFANNSLIKYQLALAYLQGRNTTQATSELEQAVEIAPKYVDAIVLLAQLRLRAGDPRSVITPLESALQLRPDATQIRTLLADAYQAVGRSEDAASLIREQIKKTPEDSQSYLVLGVILKKQKKNDEARKALEKAIELNPQNVTAIDQLTDLDLEAKAFSAVHQRADALLQKEPQSAPAYYIHGRSYVVEKNFAAAETALKKAMELDPNLIAPYNLLVAIYIQTNKLPDALKEMEKVLAKNPQYSPALLTSGIIYGQTGDFAKARDSYEKVLALNPNFVPALNNLAYIYSEKLTNLDRAAELARKAHELVPAEPSVQDTFGWVLYRQGKYQEAAELLEQSASKSPDKGEIQFHLGMANYMMGRLDEARAALEKAVSAPGDFPGKDEAKSRLALLSQAGNLSIPDLEKFAKEKSNDPVTLMRLGAAYAKAGTADKAAQAYEKALQANPKLLEAVLGLAQLNAGFLKNNAKALEYAKKARELAPADARVTATAGHIAYQAGNFPWAYSLLQESSRGLPDDPAIAHDFAWAAYSTGKVNEAQQAMQRVANAPSASDTAADAKLFLAMTALDSDDPIPGSAEPEVNKALGADPTYTPALMAKAAIELQKGDNAGAAVIYNGILQKWPDFAPAQKCLAAIYANEPANAEKAYDLANKARRTLADDPDLQRTLGALSYQRKEYARAVQLLQESGRKKPLDGKSLFFLGMAQVQLGHKAEAKEILDRALASGIPGDLAQKAQRAISEADKAASPGP